MWYWQLVSFPFASDKEFLEIDGYDGTMEECFRRIQDNVWRLEDGKGIAYFYLNNRSHPFKLIIVKREA